ncbi:MAG: DUF6675 family protein [Alkalispirochaeta sp.]
MASSRIQIRRKRLIIAFGMATLFVITLPAQVYGLLDDVPSDLRRELLANRSVSRTHTDPRDLELTPAVPGVRDAVRTLRSIRSNIVSERLILVDGPIDDEGLLMVFNAVLGVSELSYIEYYNPERDKWNDLFKESYRVHDDDDLDALPDLQVEAIPDSLSIPVLQGLPPFGEVLQTYRYEAITHDGMDGFYFSSENEWDIRYNRIRVVKPEEMVTYAWVMRGDDYLIVYGIGAAKVFTAFGLFRDRIENSFSSRTDGLFDWLSRNYLSRL